MRLQDSTIWLSLQDLQDLGLWEAYRHWLQRDTEGVVIIGEGHGKEVSYDSMPESSRQKVSREVLVNKCRQALFAGALVVNTADVGYFEGVLGRMVKGSVSIAQKAKELACTTALMAWVGEALRRKTYKAMGMQSREDLLQWILNIPEVKGWEGMRGIKTVSSFNKKLFLFQKEGKESLINLRYGNDHPRKMLTDVQALLGEIYTGTPMSTVRMQYRLNNELAESGHSLRISESTVRRYTTDAQFRFAYDAEKFGQKAWNNQFDPIIWRRPPSKAGMLWLIDGTPIELYYKYQKRSGEWTYRRLYLVAVIDAHSWKAVGYAIGYRENNDLLTAAVRDAIRKEGYAPYQMGYDGAVSEEVEAWLRSICTHAFSSAVGNARAKVIEPFFMHLFETRCKEWVNFSGLGIKSKKQCNQINEDYIRKYWQYFPTEEQLFSQIGQVMEDWNADALSPGPVINRVKEKVRYSPSECQQRSLQLQAEIMLPPHRLADIAFEWRMRPGSQERQSYFYSNGGIEITLRGVEHRYTLPPEAETYAEIVGNSFFVKYDPQNMRAVWLYDGDRQICAAYAVEYMSMALADRTEGEGKLLAEKQQLRKEAKTLAKSNRQKGKALAQATFGVEASDMKRSIIPLPEEEESRDDVESSAKAGFALPRTKYKDEANEYEELMKRIFEPQ